MMRMQQSTPGLVGEERGSITIIQTTIGMMLALVVVALVAGLKSSVSSGDLGGRCLVQNDTINLADPNLDPKTVHCP